MTGVCDNDKKFPCPQTGFQLMGFPAAYLQGSNALLAHIISPLDSAFWLVTMSKCCETYCILYMTLGTQ